MRAMRWGNDKAGLEGAFKEQLGVIGKGDKFPALTRLGAGGVQRAFGWDAEQGGQSGKQVKRDKVWWKGEVQAQLETRRGVEMLQNLTCVQKGSKWVYARIAGRKGIVREEPFKPAEWLAAESAGWDRQRILEYRVQGSRMIDTHAREGEWKWGRWRRGMGARDYKARVCCAKGCRSEGDAGVCGDEIHLFLHCRGRVAARQECALALVSFWQEHPLWDPNNQVQVRWADLSELQRVALILGETAPSWLQTRRGESREAWRREWGKVAGTIREAFERARRKEREGEWVL